MVSLCDFRAGGRDALGALPHARDHTRQVGLHVIEGIQQFRGFIASRTVNLLGEVAIRYEPGRGGGLLEGDDDRAGEHERQVSSQ